MVLMASPNDQEVAEAAAMEQQHGEATLLEVVVPVILHHLPHQQQKTHHQQHQHNNKPVQMVQHQIILMLIPMVFVQMVQHHNLVQLVQNKILLLVLVFQTTGVKVVLNPMLMVIVWICEVAAWAYHHHHHDHYWREMVFLDCQLFNPLIPVYWIFLASFFSLHCLMHEDLLESVFRR